MKLTEYLNAINHTKESLMDTEDEQVERDYAPYVVNRCLSYFIDTVLHANQMNEFSQSDKKMQFDYLKNSIRKRKRFSKWLKNEMSDDFTVVKKYYGYSNTKTKEIISLLKKEEIEDMRIYLSGGGINPQFHT